MKRLSILGSTGSIGRSTLDIVASNRDDYAVVALAAGSNLELLERQIGLFSPEVVAVAEEKSASYLRQRLKGVEVLSGVEGASAVASYDKSDFVVSAIVGGAGLVPTLAAVRAGKNIGLANKETLVMAGQLMMSAAEKNRVKIIPVDSEHSAVFQCLEGSSMSDVSRIILTASGGPFLNHTLDDLEKITSEDALKHPNWSMGKKISIDSATLMNKGLEVIEACWLFSVRSENVEVLIHPQSIVHSLVEFKDHSCLAQMSVPDMHGPISYALAYPERAKPMIKGLELHAIETLTFTKPDMNVFPALSLAYEAFRAGGTMPCVLNAANEIAVGAFLEGRLGFNQIPTIISQSMERHVVCSDFGIEEILDTDRRTREIAMNFVTKVKQ